MKIAIFSDTFFPQVNGVANVAFQSAQALSERGHEVVVFVPAHESKKKFITDHSKFEIIFLPSIPSGLYPGERVASPFSLVALTHLKKFKPDIIHTHSSFGAGWAGVLSSKLGGIKLVTTHHTFFDHYLKHIKLDYDWGKKLSWKYTIAYCNRCDLVVSPTQSLADGLLQHGLHKPMQILLNPVDTELFNPVSLEKKIILKKKFGLQDTSLVYMGRLSYEKSIDKAVFAFAEVHKNNSRVSLMIVGDGPEKKALEELVKDLGISSRVLFTGILRGDKLAEALQTNDIFITASKSENMPLSLLEAQATALPIIAVAEKGMMEIVEDGVTGFLSPADDVEKMAQNISRLIQDRILLENMGKAGRIHVEEFSHSRITDSLLEMYNKVLQKK